MKAQSDELVKTSQLYSCLRELFRSEFQPAFNRLVKAIESFTNQKNDLKTLEHRISQLDEKIKLIQDKFETHEAKITSILEYSSILKDSVVGNIDKISKSNKNKPETSTDTDGYKSVIRLSIVELRDINKLTFQEIADKLNAEGIQPFKKSGKKWYPQTVQKIYKQMKAGLQKS